MQRLALVFAVTAASFLCAIAQEDTITGAANHLFQGTEIIDKFPKVLQSFVKKIEDNLKKAENMTADIEEKIAELAEQFEELKIEHDKISREAFDKYDMVEKSVWLTRGDLKALAYKTKVACRKLEIYLEAWDNNVDNGEKRTYLKEQFRIMKELMKESFEILGKAETGFKQAVEDLSTISSSLRDFNRKVKLALDTNSDYHKTIFTAVRATAYSAAGGVTVGLAVADGFGCLGICSTVGNAVNWGATTAIVEATIASLIAKIEELDALGESLIEDVVELRENAENLEKQLKNEIDIIARWELDAEDIDEELDRIDLEMFEKLALKRKVFEDALARLRGTAEDYIARAEELEKEEATPATNRRKRNTRNLPAFLTRKHKKRF